MNLSFVAAMAIVPGLAAQHARESDPQPATWLDRVTEIHSAQADPDFGAYGTWAAGKDYKVSFHDGFCFVPYAGKSVPENLEFELSLAGIRVGAHAVAIDAPIGKSRSGTQYVYERGDVTEIYDVRAAGVEQSFRLASRPQTVGDLVVRVRVGSALQCEAVRAATHRELVFRDGQGRAVLSYGAAFALGASGKRAPMHTSYDGTFIELHLDRSTLETLAFPLTIDPIIRSWTSAPVTELASTDAKRGTTLALRSSIFYVRHASARDADCWQISIDPITGVFVSSRYQDVTTAWSAVDVASWRERPADADELHAYTRIEARTGKGKIRFFADPGRVYWLPSPATASDRHPSMARSVEPVAGRQQPTIGAMFLFQRRIGTSNQLYVQRISYDRLWQFKTIKREIVFENAAPQQLTRTTGEIAHASLAQFPVMMSFRGVGGVNIACWQERAGSSHSVHVGVIQLPNKGTSGKAVLRTAVTMDETGRDFLFPRISGIPSRVGLLYATKTATSLPSEKGLDLRFRPLDVNVLDLLKGKIQLGTVRVLEADKSYYYTGHDLTFDHTTAAHWFVSARLQPRTTGPYVPRSMILGHSGARIQRTTPRTVHMASAPTVVSVSGKWSPFVNFEGFHALCIHDGQDAQGRKTLESYRFSHNPTARSLLFQPNLARCTDSSWPDLRSASRPSRGGAVRITGSQFDPKLPTLMLLGSTRITADLDAAGMLDCRLTVAPIVTFPVANTTSTLSFELLLPDTRVFWGDLYFQALTLRSGANRAGIITTQGVLARVR